MTSTLSSFLGALRFCSKVIKLCNRKQHLQIVLAVGVSIGVVCVGVSVPWLLKEVIDSGSNGSDSHRGTLLALAYGIAWILSELLLRIQGVLTAAVMASVQAKIVEQYQLGLLSSNSGQVESAVGEHIERIRQLEASCIQFLDGVVFQVFPLVLRISLSFSAVVYSVGLGYATMLVATMLAFLYILVATHKLIGRHQLHSNETYQNSTQHLVDVIRNLFIIKIFDTQSFEMSALRSKLEDRVTSEIRSVAAAQLVGGGQIVILGLGLVAITVSMIGSVSAGTITIGDFVQVNAYMLQFLIPASYFAYVVTGIQRSAITLVSSGDHFLSERLDFATSSPDETDDKRTSPNIEVQDLSVVVPSFPRPVLNRVNLSIPAGHFVAIVGASGAGKTTLLRALIGIVRAHSGNIIVDGAVLDHADSALFRRNAGFVTQGTQLFERTLRENLVYGSNDVSNEFLDWLLNAVQLRKVVQNLPAGVDTLVTGSGTLSEGERQRVLLARAFVRRPALLLLDEPTSSLDAVTEADILRIMNMELGSSTRVVVAHRLRSIIQADLIVVMDKGEIVESGTHEALLALGGHYAGMWNIQNSIASM